MKKRLFSLSILLAVALLLAGAWQYRQPLLNDWLKPRIESYLAQRLGGEVRIGGLRLERDRLLVTALELRSGGGYRLRVASLEALARLHERYGHIQEVILQNFVPHPRYYGQEVADIADASARESWGEGGGVSPLAGFFAW